MKQYNLSRVVVVIQARSVNKENSAPSEDAIYSSQASTQRITQMVLTTETPSEV